MAGIDYSIPGQIKGIQIESPMNAMAQAMQLRNLQETSQMNALKAREYQQQVQEKNALAQLMANKEVPYGSDAFYSQLATVAPSFYEKIATGDVQRQQALAAKETREAEAEKRRFDLEQAKKKEERDALDLRLKQFNEAFPAYNIQSEDDVEARILAMANDETLGPLATRFGSLGDTLERNKAEFRRDPRNYVARLAGTSAEEILKAADARETEDYNNYKVAEVFAGRTPVDRNTYLRSRREPQAATPASTPAPATVTTPAAITTAPDGPKVLPPITVEGKEEGFDFIDPQAQRLLQLAATAKTDREAAAYKAAAEKIQAEHAKRLEEKRKTGQLTGEFQNVLLAEQRIIELEKNPTPENKRLIEVLRGQIKAANLGKATNVNVGVKLPPQEKSFEEELGKGQAKTLLENKTKAEDARDMLDTVNIGRGILKSGAITGAGADFFVGLNQALKTAGVDFGYADASANSQAYTANMAQNVGKLIKLFGAGTGLSNADRDYAEKMAGGKIALDKAALQKILDIQERAARNVIKRHNQNVKDIKTNVPLTVDVDETPAAPPMSVQDKQALDWANANPKDPRSAQIKQRLGVK